MTSSKSAYMDYQQRATEFAVGDKVTPFFARSQIIVGRVIAVWPAIGMVDVQWPHGNERCPVEDLQRRGGDEYLPPAVNHETVPGGTSTVSVPGGPAPSATRVAAAYLKKALYWASPDRHYKATQAERDSGAYTCPKCKTETLRATSYRRSGGQSERLLACPKCLFCIEKDSVVGHPDCQDNADVAEVGTQHFSRVRLTAEEAA